MKTYEDGLWDGWVRCLTSIRASLAARVQGDNLGGDIEVMLLVDEIVQRERIEGGKVA